MMAKNKITITLDEDDIKELLRMRRERDEPERVVFVPYYVPPASFVPWFGIVPPSETTAPTSGFDPIRYNFTTVTRGDLS